jgi:hypothetical protein
MKKSHILEVGFKKRRKLKGKNIPDSMCAFKGVPPAEWGFQRGIRPFL